MQIPEEILLVNNFPEIFFRLSSVRHELCLQFWRMQSHPSDSPLTGGELQILLDGLPVEPPAGRRSLTAIRAYLETLAMERQRVICLLTVNGQPANPGQADGMRTGFARIEAESIELDEMPLQLLNTARQQAASAREHVVNAVTVVLINDGGLAQEFWWNLAHELKEPLITLSLLPENICGPHGGASFAQLRKWQLQQLAGIIRTVDQASEAGDTVALSNAFENCVLPWLDKLHELICLWRETVDCGMRLAQAV